MKLPQIHHSWKRLKFWKYYADSLLPDLTGVDVLPPIVNRFTALLLPKDEVRVVILGQDPYATKGMAHGLAFSVLPHIKRLPPSLRNILREYQDDLGLPEPRNGNLKAWAEGGVLLLNTILTVEAGRPLSHQGLGWEKLSYEIMRSLSSKVVYLLWGKVAQEYQASCNGPCILSPHPSPLAKGFNGSKPFSRANQALEDMGLPPVDWRLP